MRTKLFTVVLVLIIIINQRNGLADFKGSQYCCGVGGESAYAWTSKFLFVAHGFTMPDESDWVRRHYSITKVDRDSGEVSTLRSDIYGSGMSIYATETSLFLFYQIPDSRLDGAIHTYCFMELDLHGSIIKLKTFSLHGYIQDEIAKENKLYLITYDRIYEMGIEDECPSVIYSGNDIQNDRNHVHIISDDSSLYFQDGTVIKRIDMIDYSVMEICENEFTSSNEYVIGTSIPSYAIHYTYMIIDGMLYYYCPSKAKMMSRSVSNLREDTVCDDECYFIQVDSDGMIISVKDTDDAQTEYHSHFEMYFVAKNPFSNKGVCVWDRTKLIPPGSIMIGNDQYIVHQDAIFQRDTQGSEIIEFIPIYNIS